MKLDVRLCGAPSIPTVCPSHDFAHMLSDQEFPTSIQVWRGHGQEANKGSAGGHRLTRHVQRLGHFSSRVRPPGCPCVQWGAGAVPRLRSAVEAHRATPAGVQRAERTAEGGVMDMPRSLSGSPRVPRMTAQRVTRFHPYYTRNRLRIKK